MVTDIAVVLFVAILVMGGMYVPRLGDALGRRLRGDHRRERSARAEARPSPPTARD